MEDKPWLRGIVETINAAALIKSTKLENKNRIVLILLDTALEIAFKNYLAYEIDSPVKVDKNTNRETLHKMTKKKTPFDGTLWKKVEWYYEIRCELYHENAGKTLMDSDINDFHKLVLHIITTLFDIKSELFVQDPRELLTPRKEDIYLPINNLKPIERIIVAVARGSIKSPADISDSLKKMGCKAVMKPSQVSSYMAQTSYKHYFHKDNGEIRLSDEGNQQYFKLQEHSKIDYGRKE